MRYSINPDRHAAIFGKAPIALDETPGRSRLCRSCGDWHRLDKPWPHNCRKEGPRRNPNLAMPQIAPSFQPFKTGALDSAEVITSRDDKREFMKRNDLVEYDEGVGKRNEWVEEYENGRDIVADIKRFHETDPLALPPDLKAQPMDEGGSLDEGTEINAAEIEVIK